MTRSQKIALVGVFVNTISLATSVYVLVQLFKSGTAGFGAIDSISSRGQTPTRRAFRT